jgi:hypothetical protein
LKRDFHIGAVEAGLFEMVVSGTGELFPKTGADFAELSLSPRFNSRQKSFEAYSMNADLSKNEAHFKRKAGSPVAYAMAVALFGLLSMLIVDHGPWNRPHVQAAEAHYATTNAAARAAGANVTPTMPRSALEPVPAVPKPVQPANPATP